MTLHHEYARYRTRRHFFRDCGVGLGAIALAELLAHDAARADESKNTLAPKKPHHAPKARAIIYLHMAGSPSQLDLFDYKSELVKFNGKPCPKEYLEGKRFAFIRGVPNMLGTPFKFSQHGASGAELSELWKHLPEVVDDVAIVKSCVTDQFNPGPALPANGNEPVRRRRAGFMGHVRSRQREPEPARIRCPHLRRQVAGFGQERLGQWVLAQHLPGGAVPLAGRPGPLPVQPARPRPRGPPANAGRARQAEPDAGGRARRSRDSHPHFPV